MKIKKLFKRAAQGCATVLKQLGLPGKKYGYYTPYPYANDNCRRPDLYPLKSVKAVLEKNINAFEELCREAENYNQIFETFKKSSKLTPLAPRFNQDWFCGVDGAMAYTLVRKLKPAKIVEVGTGFSTRFLAQAIKDEGLNTLLYSINPKELHGESKLCSKFFNCTLDKVPLTLLCDLKAGDILFIDASHLFMPGTDLEVLLLQVLPALPKGVYIHFHDIFLPDDYPQDEDWLWWAFNEQACLAILLTSGGYKPVFPSAYLRKEHPELLNKIFAPCHPRGHESSFWIVKSQAADIQQKP